MNQSMIERLGVVTVGEPVEAGGLQVFALFWQPGGGPDYRTLDEAVEDGSLEVTEVSDGGSVPSLKVNNKGKRAVFLMAGEHLRGGKQNRVLNASILVPAESEVPIPVSCVERGRWGYRTARFAGSGSSSHSQLRMLMHGHVTRSYRAGGTPSSDQGEVWREVDRKLSETCSESPTAYLDKAYEDTEPALAEVAEQLHLPEGACGAAFAYGGKIVGFDLFDRPATLTRLWPKLVRAYAIDARVAKDHTPLVQADVQEWLAGASAAKEEVFKSPGLGDDVRLEGQTLVAACLRVDDHPVHVEAFAQPA
jgi:hypothetical protein